MTGTVTRLLLLSLLLVTGVNAQPLHPDQLPSLQPILQDEPPPAGPGRLSWQLHQQLYWSPPATEGTLSLNPSLTYVLHDPQAALSDEVRRQDALLLTAENSDRAARDALELHQQYLSLQGSLWFQDFLLDWLDHWQMLTTADGDLAARDETSRMAAEAMLLETDDAIELQLLNLSLGGVQVVEGPEAWFRPAVELPAEPLAACLTGSRELRRLDLLQGYELLDAGLHAAGRRQRVELNVGASVALSAAGSPDLGWNLGLRVSRADHSGPQLAFDVSAGTISQSLTLRPEESEPEPAAPDLSSAFDREAIRLMELLSLSGQAARQEDIRRRTADLELAHLRDRIEAGTARRADLQPVLDSFVELAQAVSYRDWVLLSLAVECRLPAAYRQVEVYP